MSTAEQKIELVKLIMEADEETTNKIIALVQELNQPTERYTDTEIQKFHATREKYKSTDAKTILLENAHSYIRSLSQK